MSLLAALDFDFPSWLAAIIGAGLLVWRWSKIRGTTLVAPAIWTVIALVAMAIANQMTTSAYTAPESTWESPLRYFAGITTLCPAMALFGAKRPQDRAWQFIVVSLWIVLCVPTLHWWLLGAGQAYSIHLAQSWFLVALLSATAVNYLPTRFAISSLMATVAQIVFLCPFLPFSQGMPRTADYSLPLCTLALLPACFGWPRRTTAKFPLDRLWLDFRDAFGAVWGLRVQQRVNQSAEMYDWELRLNWHGFTPLEGAQISPEVEKAVRDNLGNLLRRFVSPEWITERLGDQ